MECPECKRSMHRVKTDVSYGDYNKKYDREQYRCMNDDVWVTVEIPQEKDEK